MDSYLTYYRAKRRAEISNKEIDNFTFIDKTPCERIDLICLFSKIFQTVIKISIAFDK
jgi:hypothetical protein